MSTKHFRANPTGNGRRQSFRHHLMPGMTNTYMLAGESGLRYYRSVERGIYCALQRRAGRHQQRRLVFSVTEATIEGGRITAPIRNVNLIGNGPDVLRNVTAVGGDFAMSDGRWTCGKDGSRSCRRGHSTTLISGMTVGGTAA
jgi:TldD protein